MDHQSRVAFVQAQVACMLAELAAMQADNQIDLSQGLRPQWVHKDFMDLQNKYLVGHNAVIDYLRS